MSTVFPGKGAACPTTKGASGPIPADKDQMTQPVGCVGPMLLQVPQDGTQLEVSIFHQLQRSCHQPNQTQELERWFVCPYFEKDLTWAVSARMHISGRYSLPRSVWNLAPMYTRSCVGASSDFFRFTTNPAWTRT